nr:hypothetical protein [Tanacetum cinerariifolium]
MGIIVTPTEPIDSLSMGDEHLNTTSATESDEFIKSCVENLVPNPTIIPMEIDQHSLNAESDLIESFPNRDSSVTISSKIGSLFDEFAGELTLLKSFPPGIDKPDCHPEIEICLTKRLLYDNSSPRPPEEIVSDISNADIESFSPSPIPNEDSLEAFQPSAECPMMINGKNTPVSNVPLFHFYPLDQFKYGGIRPNGKALRKCILSGPYKPTTILVQAVEATDDSPAIPEHTTVETPMNMSPKNKAHFEAEKEAIHLILSGIGDEIYSTIDDCQIAQEMWEAIERLQQGESLNIQDVKTNLFWEFEWSRFVTIVKQQHKLDEVSYHKLFDILKQYQKKVNELCAERLARNANPLALVATTQADQDPYYQTSRHKGKEIAKPITPPAETASEEDSDPEQAQRDNDIQKNLALIAKYFKKIFKPNNNNLRTSLNSRNKNVDTTLRENVGSPVMQQPEIQCFNCKEFGHFAKECRKLKRVKDSAYHKEKMLLCKQAKQGVPLQAELYDWLADT